MSDLWVIHKSAPPGSHNHPYVIYTSGHRILAGSSPALPSQHVGRHVADEGASLSHGALERGGTKQGAGLARRGQ
eukprot:1384529-Pleurochrysis_carterae.AAC.2